MLCLKNIPNSPVLSTGNNGSSFPVSLSDEQCMLAPDYYLILEESTTEENIPLFTQHPRFIEVQETDIA